MDKNLIIDEDERASLDEMIREDIKFITGRDDFDYFMCFAMPSEEIGLNILTNVEPGEQLKNMINVLKKIIDDIDYSEIDPNKSGCINLTIESKDWNGNNRRIYTIQYVYFRWK